jgi:hypothetical protein
VVEMVTLGYLRSLAELNLCENCFQKYKALIEPSIKGYLSQPLSDWRQAESEITQIVMKTKGVFKGNTWVLRFNKGEEEKAADYIDVKAFREIEKMGFKDKIDYLHNTGMLQDSSYVLLDKARQARNKIHIEPILAELSEEDYALFSMASWISSQIWSAMRFDWEKEIIINIKSNTEKVAEQWLKTLQMKPQEA